MDKRQKRFRPIYARKPAKNDEESLCGCGYGKSALSSALETAFFTLRAKKVVAKYTPKTLAPCALRFPAALFARAMGVNIDGLSVEDGAKAAVVPVVCVNGQILIHSNKMNIGIGLLTEIIFQICVKVANI